MNTTYKKLTRIREKNNLNYEAMAKKLNISTCYYWQLEHKKKQLYYFMAKKIAAVFDLKPDDLFYEGRK